jgi:hypothetical protein
MFSLAAGAIGSTMGSSLPSAWRHISRISRSALCSTGYSHTSNRQASYAPRAPSSALVVYPLLLRCDTSSATCSDISRKAPLM